MKAYICLIISILSFLLIGSPALSAQQKADGGAKATHEKNMGSLCKAIVLGQQNKIAAYLGSSSAKELANGNCGLPSNLPPLHVAALYKNVEATKTLIKAGADVNAKSYKGYTPLHYALMNDDLMITSVLYENGADAFIPTPPPENRTGLDIAWNKGGYMFSYFLIKFIEKIAKAQEIEIVVGSSEPDGLVEKNGKKYFYVSLPMEPKFEYMAKKMQEWEDDRSWNKGPNPITLEDVWLTVKSMADIFDEALQMGILDTLVEELLKDGHFHLDTLSPTTYTGPATSIYVPTSKVSITLLEYARRNNLTELEYLLEYESSLPAKHTP